MTTTRRRRRQRHASHRPGQTPRRARRAPADQRASRRPSGREPVRPAAHPTRHRRRQPFGRDPIGEQLEQRRPQLTPRGVGTDGPLHRQRDQRHPHVDQRQVGRGRTALARATARYPRTRPAGAKGCRTTCSRRLSSAAELRGPRWRMRSTSGSITSTHEAASRGAACSSWPSASSSTRSAARTPESRATTAAAPSGANAARGQVTLRLHRAGDSLVLRCGQQVGDGCGSPP